MKLTALLRTCAAGDRDLFLRLAPGQTSLAGRLWNRCMSRLADGPLYVVLGLLPLFLGHPMAFQFMGCMALGFAIELPAYKLIKKTCKRSRPCHAELDRENLLPVPDQYSFPSGHTAGAFVLAGSTLACFPMLGLPAYAFAVAVGYSRVYNRLHFPADILAGAGLGSLCVGLARSITFLSLNEVTWSGFDWGIFG